jgi:hypothetical protein
MRRAKDHGDRRADAHSDQNGEMRTGRSQKASSRTNALRLEVTSASPLSMSSDTI